MSELEAAATVKGIKDTKELLVFLFLLGAVAKEAKENDGKINYMDAILLMKLMPSVGPALDGIDQIPSELKDLDQVELDELAVTVAEEIKKVISKESLITQIVAGLELAKALHAFVKTL